MRRLLSALVLVLACAVSAVAADHNLPWRAFSDPAMRAAYVGGKMSACPVGSELKEVYIATFREGSRQWTMLYAADTGRIIFVYDPAPDNRDANPTLVGVGTIDLKTPGAHNVIPPLRWAPFSQFEGVSPCAMLFPAEA